jgi:hypothetical protein
MMGHAGFTAAASQFFPRCLELTFLTYKSAATGAGCRDAQVAVDSRRLGSGEGAGVLPLGDAALMRACDVKPRAIESGRRPLTQVGLASALCRT